MVRRMKSLVAFVSIDGASYCLSNIEEQKEICWNMRSFWSLNNVGFYDFLWSTNSGKIVGVELHLTETYDNILCAIPSFERMPTDDPTISNRWQLWFSKKET